MTGTPTPTQLETEQPWWTVRSGIYTPTVKLGVDDMAKEQRSVARRAVVDVVITAAGRAPGPPGFAQRPPLRRPRLPIPWQR